MKNGTLVYGDDILYVGVGERSAAPSGATGVLYIDDIAFGHPIDE